MLVKSCHDAKLPLIKAMEQCFHASSSQLYKSKAKQHKIYEMRMYIYIHIYIYVVSYDQNDTSIDPKQCK